MGVCRLNDKFPARRIDIRFVDYSQYYAALIYFTGSKNFNIQIRNKAIEKGYSLNEYGLIDKKTEKKIVLNSEKDIFEFLNIKYLKPCERNF